MSLGTVGESVWNPLDHLLEQHTVLVPTLVTDELRDTADYDDASGQGAARVLERQPALDVREVSLSDTVPLDDGENTAVTLANDCGAQQLLCDEFNRLALVHASLVDTRLVTTPTVLVGLAKNGVVDAPTAASLLEELRAARSWSNNASVDRARTVLQTL